MHHSVSIDYLTSPRHATRLSASLGPEVYGLMLSRARLREAELFLRRVDETELYSRHSKHMAQDLVRSYRRTARAYLMRAQEWAKQVAEHTVSGYAGVMGTYAEIHAGDMARATKLAALPQPYETPTAEQITAACWGAASAALRLFGRRCYRYTEELYADR